MALLKEPNVIKQCRSTGSDLRLAHAVRQCHSNWLMHCYRPTPMRALVRTWVSNALARKYVQVLQELCSLAEHGDVAHPDRLA